MARESGREGGVNLLWAWHIWVWFCTDRLLCLYSQRLTRRQTEQAWPRQKHALGHFSLHLYALANCGCPPFGILHAPLAETTWTRVFIFLYPGLHNSGKFISLKLLELLSSCVLIPPYPAAKVDFHDIFRGKLGPSVQMLSPAAAPPLTRGQGPVKSRCWSWFEAVLADWM